MAWYESLLEEQNCIIAHNAPQSAILASGYNGQNNPGSDRGSGMWVAPDVSSMMSVMKHQGLIGSETL